MSSDNKGLGPTLYPLAFGGWNSYQEWADHEFMLRIAALERDEPHEEVAESQQKAIVDVPPAVPAESVDSVQEPACGADAAAPPANTDPTDVDTADSVDSSVDLEHSALMLRPYVRTRGRVRPEHQLQLETLVSSVPEHEAAAPMNSDLQQIHDMCVSPRSVAEISAHLAVPVMAARVLISDAIDAGLVIVHEGLPSSNNRASPALLEKTYEGLHKLRDLVGRARRRFGRPVPPKPDRHRGEHERHRSGSRQTREHTTGLTK